MSESVVAVASKGLDAVVACVRETYAVYCCLDSRGAFLGNHEAYVVMHC